MIVERGQLGEAHFSECRTYRYLLTRPPATPAGELAPPIWWVTFCMLNPSTADHDQDDPTIAKCRKFARRICEEREGPLAHLGVRIVNVFAIRATDPRECLAHPKPIGGTVNDERIVLSALNSFVTICAWGAHAKARGREVRALLVGHGVRLHRLGKPNKDGSPKHPLYLKDSTELVPWT